MSSTRKGLVAAAIRSSLTLGDPKIFSERPKTCVHLVSRSLRGSYLEVQGLARSDILSDRWRCNRNSFVESRPLRTARTRKALRDGVTR